MDPGLAVVCVRRALLDTLVTARRRHENIWRAEFGRTHLRGVGEDSILLDSLLATIKALPDNERAALISSTVDDGQVTLARALGVNHTNIVMAKARAVARVRRALSAIRFRAGVGA